MAETALISGCSADLSSDIICSGLGGGGSCCGGGVGGAGFAQFMFVSVSVMINERRIKVGFRIVFLNEVELMLDITFALLGSGYIVLVIENILENLIIIIYFD